MPNRKTARALPIERFFEPMDAPMTAHGKALHDYWRSLAEPPALPAREAVRVEDLHRLGCLERVFILEPIDDGRDWRYRLLGTTIVEMLERDITGVPFRECMIPEQAEKAIALSNQARETRQPIFLHARFVSPDHEHRPPLETMSLPILARDGADVWLMGGTFLIE